MTNRETWEPQRAVRRNTALSIGLEGPPGGGKTASALLLAQGIQRVRGGRIIVIDTENRSAKYAGISIAGSAPFDFDIVPFDPPFRASRYLEAIKATIARKPAAIIVDSMSDEHEGEGGRLEWKEEELDKILQRQRIPVDDWAARERNSMSAWKPSSEARTRLANFINRGLGPTPLILCFRAREKTKPVEQEKNGRKIQVPTNIGYTPIAPADIVHQLDIMCLLPARADGLPMWRSDKLHQDFVLKLPEQFRGIFAEGQRITPAIGEALARWAKGEEVQNDRPSEDKPRQQSRRQSAQQDKGTTAAKPKAGSPEWIEQLVKAAETKAGESDQAYQDWLSRLTETQREYLDPYYEDRIKPAIERRKRPQQDGLPKLEHEGTS